MTVIKCGGSSLPRLSKGFLDFVAARQQCGSVVLVHGGGPAIAELEKRLALKSDFNAKGQRITNLETLKVVVQSLCGEVNSELVSLLLSAEVPAFGLSGIDGGLLKARLKDFAELGWVGEIIAVRREILQNLCAQGFVPVVAPVSLSAIPEKSNSPRFLNVNADAAASAIARALEASTLVFASDVPGIMDEAGRVLELLNVAQLRQLIASGAIYGGMIPKVEAAIAVLQASALEQVLIVDGTAADLSQVLRGTRITL